MNVHNLFLVQIFFFEINHCFNWFHLVIYLLLIRLLIHWFLGQGFFLNFDLLKIYEKIFSQIFNPYV